MKKQVLKEKMIGGAGWTADVVNRFGRGKAFYTIPCSAVEKGGDPFGRIVHDYGFYVKGSYSINAAHSCTTVVYDSTFQVASILDGVE